MIYKNNKNLINFINSLNKEKNTKLFNHIQNVMNISINLSKIYEINLEYSVLSALLHDYNKDHSLYKIIRLCKYYNFYLDDMESNNHSLAHSKGAYIYSKYIFGITQNEILSSILYHTTGNINMNIYTKILFVSDYCSYEKKNYKSNEILKMAEEKKIDQAVYNIIKIKINKIVARSNLIHFNTISAYNYYSEIINN